MRSLDWFLLALALIVEIYARWIENAMPVSDDYEEPPLDDEPRPPDSGYSPKSENPPEPRDRN